MEFEYDDYIRIELIEYWFGLNNGKQPRVINPTRNRIHYNVEILKYKNLWFLNQREKIQIVRIRTLEKYLHYFIRVNFIKWDKVKLRTLELYLMKNRTISWLRNLIHISDEEISTNEKLEKTQLVRLTFKYQHPIYPLYKTKTDKIYRKTEILYYQNGKNITRKVVGVNTHIMYEVLRPITHVSAIKTSKKYILNREVPDDEVPKGMVKIVLVGLIRYLNSIGQYRDENIIRLLIRYLIEEKIITTE